MHYLAVFESIIGCVSQGDYYMDFYVRFYAVFSTGQSVRPGPGPGRTALCRPAPSFSEFARQVRAKDQDGRHFVVPRRPPPSPTIPGHPPSSSAVLRRPPPSPTVFRRPRPSSVVFRCFPLCSVVPRRPPPSSTTPGRPPPEIASHRGARRPS